jgi:hypothetical protein
MTKLLMAVLCIISLSAQAKGGGGGHAGGHVGGHVESGHVTEHPVTPNRTAEPEYRSTSHSYFPWFWMNHSSTPQCDPQKDKNCNKGK